MLSLSDIIDYCRAESIAGKLYPTEASDWRYFCREYSKTFHTPLSQVMDMDAEHVILSVLEDGMSNRSLRNEDDLAAITEDLRRIEDPDYDVNQEKVMDDFAAGIEEWEEERQASGAPLPKKGVVTPAKQKPPKELPKEGGINLSYLSEEEHEDPESFED